MLRAQHRLGDFEIIRLLGKGGMGEVYEAQQLNPPRRVALKVLAPWLADDEDCLQRFWREAAVPARLDHPNIVRIISTGKTDDGLAYYTMQLVRGISLADLIKRTHEPLLPGTLTAATVSNMAPLGDTPSQGIPPAEAPTPLPEPVPTPALQEYRQDRFRFTARMGVQAARALADAHRQGFLHRDIKPSNLMVDQHDHLYLLDFGLTRARDPGAMGTRPGTVLGTPWFMSPEQARGETVDPRSDLYSLGISLYQLLTGGMGPFTAQRDDSEAVLAQVKAGTHLSVRLLAPEIPPELERIISRAIHPKPRRRYQRAEELAAELEGFLSRTQNVPRPVPGGQRRWLLAGLGVLVAAVLVALALFLRFPRSEEKSKPDPNDGVRASPKVPEDYPELLLKRPWRSSIALLKEDFEPLWHRRLDGEGKFARTPFQLMLNSATGSTLLALDDDPQRRWFEFAIDLNGPMAKAGTNRFGVFFGWRDLPERPRSYHFFIVEVDEHPSPGLPKGMLRIDAVRIQHGRGAEQEMKTAWELGRLPLTKGPDWHHLVIRALGHKLTVTVDDNVASPFHLDLARFRQDRPRMTEDLHLRGALGIWSHDGMFASFRNAHITALPLE
jgi:serine/threonine protein kinase